MILKNRQDTALIIYIFISILVLVFLNKALGIKQATVFDKYYSIAVIVLISLYGILFCSKGVITLIKSLVLIGVILSVVGCIVYYFRNLNDIWFSFEMDSYSWLGISGIVRFVFNNIFGILLGLLLWILKNGLIRMVNKR